jgi:hypothetical protein
MPSTNPPRPTPSSTPPMVSRRVAVVVTRSGYPS